MAIVEMKRLQVLGLKEDRDRLLRVLQRTGCVEVSEVDGEARAYAGRGAAAYEDTESRLARIRWAIGQLGRYEPKQGMLASFAMPEASEAEAEQVRADEGQLMAVVEAVEACERRSGDLRGQEARIRAQMDQLLPWRGLDVPVEEIRDTRDTRQYVGMVSSRALDQLVADLAEAPVTIEHVGDERDTAMLWIVAHKSAEDAVREALRAANFSPMHFTGETGKASQLLDQLTQEQQAVLAERDALEDELRVLSADTPRLRVLYELVAQTASRDAATTRLAETGSTFLLEGWAPAAAVDDIEARLRKAAPDIAFASREPLDDEKPPTLLHNRNAVQPFESVVTAYSYPDPRGIDPTAVMAPFFACLFGMMLSDAGYGAVMAIAIPLIIHFLKPKPGMRNLLKLMFFCGVATVIWGAIFNTWFGTNPSFLPTAIDMLNNPIPMLAVCIAVGAIHLFTGLGVAAYMNIKRGKPLDALFDQGFWFLLIVGLAALLLPQVAGIAKWVAIGSAVGILLTAGRSNPSIPGKLIGGAGALYGISSWLSDLLSYMRLFGMGLATGVIGMVFNMLAGLMMGNVIGFVLGIVVLIVGHVFNFGINALGAYVHSCRLQYIEFFSKFYEDGGVPFRPLTVTPRFVAIREEVEQ